MSIATEITRLQTAKSNLKTSIENKGVTVPSATLIDGYASLVDQISGGGGSGLEYETGTWTPASDIARGTIIFSNTHTNPPAFYAISDVTGNLDATQNSDLANVFCDVYRLWGAGFPYSSSAYRYAIAICTYKGSSSAANTTVLCTKNSDDTGSGNSSYPRYWASPIAFYPFTNSTSRYWRAGRTYKWIAIWV